MNERNLEFDVEGDGTLLLRLSGDWRTEEHLPPRADAEARLAASPGLTRLAFEAEGLGAWDTGLMTFLVGIMRQCRERGVEVELSGLPDGVQSLLRLAFAVPEQATGRGEARTPLLARAGEWALAASAASREGLAFLGSALIALGRFVMGRAQYRRSDLWLFIQECGAQALGIVSLISFLVGLILAFVGAQQLALFGAEIFVANLVGIAMVREMAPIMTGIIMAGRTGAAFAAQLGTMTVNEEIDALQTLGIQPMEYLVLPRMLALILMMPLLCLYADLVGILGGALVSTSLFDITPVQYFEQTRGSLSLTQIWIGVIKAVIFGVLVALAGCLRGMQSGRSASAVGAAATSAVVTSIVLIIVSDAIFAVALDALGI